MASIYDANTNYQVTGTDLRANPGLVTREYLIDLYPTFVDNFRFAGLWGWGRNSNGGQLGDNTRTDKSSPVQTIAGGTNWKQISTFQSLGGVGDGTSAIKTDGTLWLWGGNTYGQLGDNTTTSKSSPVQTIAGGTNWSKLATNHYSATHVAAIKTDGTLWLWGYNSGGNLGTNDVVHRSSPVQTISGGTNWKQVSIGPQSGIPGGGHTAAIKTDGTLWLWGSNSNGQLGDNTITSKSSPIQTVSGGTNWKQVSCGGSHTAAIKTDGTLWLWGDNTRGQLGINDITHRSSPVQTVSGGTNWKQVSCGGSNSAAIKTDGTLWLWGWNDSGQLGDNSTTHRSSPVQTVAGGTNWKQVSGGSQHSAAIKTDGTLWLWGINNNGQLGDNTATRKSSPIQTVSGGTNWKQVTCGVQHTFAIRDDSSDPFRAEPL
jgi:alpha-tubulin suppressor-like RCC1 family protein